MLHHLRARSRRVLLSGRRGPKSCVAAALAHAAAPTALRHASSATAAAVSSAANAADAKAAPQPTLRDFVAAAAANGGACAGAARAMSSASGSGAAKATADGSAKANGSTGTSASACGVLSSNAVKLRAGYQWSPEKEPTKVPGASDILNPALIRSLLDSTKAAAKSRERVREILSAARERALLKDDRSSQAAACTSEYVQGLTLQETATLLNVDSGDNELMAELFATALDIKRRIYGNRIVLFAPLYLSNFCINSCTYCAFRVQNADLLRSKLSDAELKAEVAALQKQGHRRLLLLTGEHPQYTFDDFLRAVDVVANVRTEPHGTIRRLNVEIPTLSVSDFRRLKATDQVGTYTLFQESYDEAVYNRSHPSRGRAKGDFEYRLQTMDRAQVAGVDDNGLGALFGLGDYKFEVMGLLSHGQHLDRTYGAGPHTISVPRMRPAHNAPDAMTPPHPVSDADFMKLVAIIRCAVPYTGMILSTRETVTMRQQMLQLGISQMSAGSKTDVGSYYKGDVEAEWTRLNPNMTAQEKAQRRAELAAADLLHKREVRAAAAPGAAVAARAAVQEPSAQFEISDERSLDETVAGLMASGFVPSWCTACYRLGRTGQKFMKIAKSGNIQNYCHPNALLTLKEFERDYASPSTSALANTTIERESADVPSDFRRKQLQKKLARITSGQRDLYF